MRVPLPVVGAGSFTAAYPGVCATRRRSRAAGWSVGVGGTQMCAVEGGANEDDADAGVAPTPKGDWRKVRAALHYGSNAAFEAASAGCYRPGFWSHPVRARVAWDGIRAGRAGLFTD